MRLAKYLGASRLAIILAAALIGATFGSRAYAQEADDAGDDPDTLNMGNPLTVAKQLGVSGDDMRPNDQFHTLLFGRPLTIGGEVELAGQARHNLDPSTDDGVAKFTPEVQLELLYEISDQAVGFVEIKAFSDDEVWKQNGRGDSEAGVDLREAWVLFPNLLGSKFSLQAGKQQYQDRREWWWNENLDSVRLHYVDGQVSGFLGVAEKVVRTSTVEGIEPEDNDVFRVLGNAAYSWSKHDRLEAFMLVQQDHSDPTQLGALVGEDSADESDADLTWYGVRGRMRQKLGDLGKGYWNVDLAAVKGDETVTEFDDATAGLVEAIDNIEQEVTGWAGEVSFSWELPIDLEPVLSVAYAHASGDSNTADSKDDSFRQTGLQGNNSKFRGVSRFRYYGETLRPELSNVDIATLSVGSPAPSPAGGEAWFEVIYHNYRQSELSTDFKTDRLDIDPTGLDDDLGDAIDMVYAFEVGTNWEFELTLGGFRYGDAFAANEGKWASSMSFKLDYNF